MMSLKERVINASPGFLVKWIASPYIGGYSAEEVIESADKLWKERSIHSSLDILGEDANTDEEVEFYVDAYFDLLNKINDSTYTTVSLKPTQLGSHQGNDVLYKNMEKIIKDAARKKVLVTIDMEDHNYTDLTLSLYKKLRKNYDNVWGVLQSRLFRTEKDIDNFVGFNAHIRLCIGIYLEPAEISLQKKPEMKEKLLDYAEKLFDMGHYVAFATHDEALIHKALDSINKKNIAKDRYEFQMLYGVPKSEIQDFLVKEGHKFTLYIPYCLKWQHAISYLKRRLIANPNMGLYVANNFIKKLFGKR
jgi:proline dehydrogenase